MDSFNAAHSSLDVAERLLRGKIKLYKDNGVILKGKQSKKFFLFPPVYKGPIGNEINLDFV